jgi:TonB family protein
MRDRKLIWLFVAALPLWPLLTLAQTTELRDARALAVYAPPPPYPYEARVRHEQGSGVAMVAVDPATGNVTNVVMTVSTGVKSLDDAAVSTFSRWRFKRGTVSKVRMPITFTLAGGRGSVIAAVHVEKALPMEHLLEPLLGKGNVISASIPILSAAPGGDAETRPWRL